MVVKPVRNKGRAVSLKQLHARKCFLLGINDAGKVAKLWAVESARIEKVKAETKPRPRGRRKEG